MISRTKRALCSTRCWYPARTTALSAAMAALTAIAGQSEEVASLGGETGGLGLGPPLGTSPPLVVCAPMDTVDTGFRPAAETSAVPGNGGGAEAGSDRGGICGGMSILSADGRLGAGGGAAMPLGAVLADGGRPSAALASLCRGRAGGDAPRMTMTRFAGLCDVCGLLTTDADAVTADGTPGATVAGGAAAAAAAGMCFTVHERTLFVTGSTGERYFTTPMQGRGNVLSR